MDQTASTAQGSRDARPLRFRWVHVCPLAAAASQGSSALTSCMATSWFSQYATSHTMRGGFSTCS